MRTAAVISALALVLTACAGPADTPSAACGLTPAEPSGRFAAEDFTELLGTDPDLVEESYTATGPCSPAPVRLGCVTAPLVDVGDPRVLTALGVTAAHRVSVRGDGGDEDESALELTGTVLETPDPAALLERLAATCTEAELAEGHLILDTGEFQAEPDAVVGIETMSTGWHREDVAALLG
ncbi:hypothetical protein Afil01_15520 [Actinorhabdospora filicis]|uniref:Uncharacterized protein n=1 Tax=Actinorhabdospora filicis TaxID=1785913 RepID=A0A9W6W9K9_9ACTN|nr:hypothetical protein [Actinorhabdospora filicis]GLZ76745.1 hypothetical protein Afil01_15520 [Actinorhabdospora filicis]